MSQSMELSTFWIIFGTVFGLVAVTGASIALLHDRAWGLRRYFCLARRSLKGRKSRIGRKHHGARSVLPLYSTSGPAPVMTLHDGEKHILPASTNTQPGTGSLSSPYLESQLSTPPMAQLSSKATEAMPSMCHGRFYKLSRASGRVDRQIERDRRTKGRD
ncbi:hypothetical protein QBC41DRAFT_304967 [Cercophora samala]|uniref:Uncharacterized protein n=1 Tax=Cercophora samala TaxID=330535 RepID=A0AA39ZAC9_9PEZI|nr:hypothetical protein QBC41DRAFT_304967 [Cercophora samala]